MRRSRWRMSLWWQQYPSNRTRRPVAAVSAMGQLQNIMAGSHASTCTGRRNWYVTANALLAVEATERPSLGGPVGLLLHSRSNQASGGAEHHASIHGRGRF